MTAPTPPPGAVTHQTGTPTIRDIGTPLGPAGSNEGHMRVTLADATTDQPRRVNLLTAWRWTSPQLLRDAATALQAAADWLDTPTAPDDPQLTIYDELAADG